MKSTVGTIATAALAVFFLGVGGFRQLCAQEQQPASGQSKAVSGQSPADAPKPIQAWDYKRRSSSEQKILDQLEQDTTLAFIEVPLADVLDYLRDVHDIPIQVDGRRFQEAGISTDEPITINLKGLSLRDSLDRMLEQLELDVVVHHGVLDITTQDAASRLMETRVYDTRQLRGLSPEQLIQAIRTSIRRGQWGPEKPEGDRAAGDESSRGRIAVVGHALIVTHNWRVHEEIVDLLEQLATFQKNPLYGGM